MFLKQKLKSCLRAFAARPKVARLAALGPVRAVLGRLPGAGAFYAQGWNRQHPFDREHGTDTSGVVSPEELRALAHPAFAHATVYGGSQPSLVRMALAGLPALETSTFVDLGCGKGRPLIVASEFPFRDIVGVELSADLARIARANATIIAKRHPQRTPIRVDVGDATTYRLPPGNLVLFLYHAFSSQLVMKVVRAVEAAITSEKRSVYVILYNPVGGPCFDASPLLERRFARMVPCAPEERGYGPDPRDAIVIWQGGDVPPPPGGAAAPIVITVPNWRAELTE